MQSGKNGICIVVGLTVSLERTLIMVEYEDKRKGHCTALDKMLLFRVTIIVIASSVMVLGRLKKEEERRKSKFRPMLTCSSRKLCINVCSIFDLKSALPCMFETSRLMLMRVLVHTLAIYLY